MTFELAAASCLSHRENESRASMKPTSKHDDPNASLSPRLQAHIGSKLKQFYDEIVAEPIPDRFKMLLDQLEQKETTSDNAIGSKR